MENNTNAKVNAGFRVTKLDELEPVINIAARKLKERLDDNTTYYISIEVFEELPE